jgi:hypothetical protein
MKKFLLFLLFSLSTPAFAGSFPPELENFLKIKEFKAKYRIKLKTENVKSAREGTYTYYRKEDKSRIDMSVPSQNVETRTYTINNKSYACAKTPQDRWFCFLMSSTNFTSRQTEKPLNMNDLFSSEKEYKKIGTKIVNGHKTTCYLVKDGEKTTICADKDGIVWYLKTEGNESTMEMTLEEFKKKVSNDAFKLPAPPLAPTPAPQMPPGQFPPPPGNLPQNVPSFPMMR